MTTLPPSSDAYARYKAQRYFGSLDGVRFIAIAAVLWHHGGVWDRMEEPFMLLIRGFTGVNLFFVLSGFLITTLLLREEERTGAISIPGFYRRRALRILPAYFLLITAVSAYYVLWKGEGQFAPMVPYYYLFLANFLNSDIPLLAPTWSLSVEEQYYLFWPAFMVLLAGAAVLRARLLVALIAICVLSDAGMLAFLGLKPIETAYATFELPANGYSAILLGSLLGIVMNTQRGFALVHALLGHKMAPLAMVGLMIALQILLPGDLTGLPFFVLHLSMAAFIASVVVREDHVLAPALRWRPVARVGEISYGLYLYHLIGLHITTVTVSRLDLAPDLAAWTIFVLYIPISIAISEVSFRLYETPFLRLKSPAPRQVARRQS